MFLYTIPTLKIEPEASRKLLFFLTGVHFFALLIIPFLPLTLSLKIPISLLVISCLIRSVYLHVFCSSASAIQRIEWDADGEWRLFLINGESQVVQLCPSSYVQPWIVILNFSTGRFTTRSLLLIPDAVDQNLLRRLRVRLRQDYS